jgi:hypothetical protein
MKTAAARSMDLLVVEHRHAIRHYKDTVRRLRELRLQGDHKGYMNFLSEFVVPARTRCREILDRWLFAYPRSSKNPPGDER